MRLTPAMREVGRSGPRRREGLITFSAHRAGAPYLSVYNASLNKRLSHLGLWTHPRPRRIAFDRDVLGLTVEFTLKHDDGTPYNPFCLEVTGLATGR